MIGFDGAQQRIIGGMGWSKQGQHCRSQANGKAWRSPHEFPPSDWMEADW
jgi:hypothetical protein